MICYNCMHDKGESAVCPYCGTRDVPAPASYHLPPGTILNDRYVIGRVLGEGGFGITYIALDNLLEIVVAIKEYFVYGLSHRAHVADNTVSVSVGKNRDFFEKGKDRFLKEAKNIARFQGKRGIVGVTNFIEENNTAYIVMEYLDGINLRQYLKKNGVISVEHTLDLITPVIKSLEKVHEAGIIHRDISPDNLMVLSDGSVKLMDFGAARDFVDDHHSMSVILNSYAPEEQYRRNGEQGPWTDVYGICATIYRCITGKTPDAALYCIFEDNLKRPSQLGADISPEMENVLMYGLALRKNDRCQNMTELMECIKAAEKASRVHAEKEQLTRPLSPLDLPVKDSARIVKNEAETVLADEPHEPYNRPPKERGVTWRCPRCGRLHTDDDNYCSCGQPSPRRLRQSSGSPVPLHPVNINRTPYVVPFQKPSSRAPVQRNVGANEWRCPKCGRVNQKYVGTCGCGQEKPEYIGPYIPSAKQTGSSSAAQEDPSFFIRSTDSSNSQPRAPIQQTSLMPGEWRCPKCGVINQRYVGTCGCGQEKPQ